MAVAYAWMGLYNQPWLFLPPAAFWGMHAHVPPQLVSLPGTGKLFSWSTLMAHSYSPSSSQRGWVRSTCSVGSSRSPSQPPNSSWVGCWLLFSREQKARGWIPVWQSSWGCREPC